MAPQHLFLEDMAIVTISNAKIKMAWVGNYITPLQSNPTAFYTSVEVSIPIPASTPVTTSNLLSIIYLPQTASSPAYHRLHKVHFNAGDFHCGGFYSHTNNNKATFVTAPEQAIKNLCGQTCISVPSSHFPPPLNPLSVIPISVTVNYNLWHNKKYNFCDTDCNDAPLNAASNANCGN
jgi:hypothetical protein